jgi:HAD superfamily hydrolase (TIGR01509 family)
MRTEKPRLEAILFDFMGVLLFLRSDYAAEKTVDAVDDMIGGVVDDEAFRAKVRDEFKLDEKEFQEILKRIPEKYEAYPPLWNLLPILRKRYQLGIINNGTRLTFPYFDEKLQLGERFDLILSSGAEGVLKPDARIYLRACTRLGVESRQCLFMDDSEENILGASQAGMQTVHWNAREEGFQRFMEILKADGLEI